MKAIRYSVAIILLFSVVACQKEISQEASGLVPPATSALRMKIDGKQWEADRTASATIIGGFIIIDGLKNDNTSLNISLTDSVTGIYVLDQGSFGAAGFLDGSTLAYTTNQGSDTTDAGGMVVVNQIDRVNKTISGTFKFKVFRNVDRKRLVITEGVFDKLKYGTTVPQPPASVAVDTLTVKIDSTAWVAGSITASVVSRNLLISGADLTQSRSVGLIMPADIKKGTYDMSFSGGTYIGQYTPGVTGLLVSNSGKLTIIDHNPSTKKIRGNFEFNAVELTGTQTASLTQGYFSLKYN